MNWNYRCPNCGEWRQIDWEKRKEQHKCHKDDTFIYLPPTPAQQNDAFVDTHYWPDDIENVVVKTKGSTCTAPNCNKDYETLDHRIPYSQNGKTSVENLYPMCESCNRSKGDGNYFLWVWENN